MDSPNISGAIGTGTSAAGAMPKLMAGRRGVVMGVANDHSIAWGIAQALHRHGAEMCFTFQGPAFERRVRPLAESLDSALILPCDVAEEGDLDAVFAAMAARWDRLDFVVHAVAYTERDGLKGRYVDTSEQNFCRTLAISCYSFTAVARRAAAMMGEGGALLTLTFDGAARVMPNYNVMGVAKAALEASVRYLAADLGSNGIRVNAISAGPMRTLAGSAVGDARHVYNYARDNAPLRRNVALEEIGSAGVYLLSDLSAAVTGTIQYVDCGVHVIGVPPPERQSAVGATGNMRSGAALKT